MSLLRSRKSIFLLLTLALTWVVLSVGFLAIHLYRTELEKVENDVRLRSELLTIGISEVLHKHNAAKKIQDGTTLAEAKEWNLASLPGEGKTYLGVRQGELALVGRSRIGQLWTRSFAAVKESIGALPPHSFFLTPEGNAYFPKEWSAQRDERLALDFVESFRRFQHSFKIEIRRARGAQLKAVAYRQVPGTNIALFMEQRIDLVSLSSSVYALLALVFGTLFMVTFIRLCVAAISTRPFSAFVTQLARISQQKVATQQYALAAQLVETILPLKDEWRAWCYIKSADDTVEFVNIIDHGKQLDAPVWKAAAPDRAEFFLKKQPTEVVFLQNGVVVVPISKHEKTSLFLVFEGARTKRFAPSIQSLVAALRTTLEQSFSNTLQTRKEQRAS